jgi:hypothetical protein
MSPGSGGLVFVWGLDWMRLFSVWSDRSYCAIVFDGLVATKTSRVRVLKLRNGERGGVRTGEEITDCCQVSPVAGRGATIETRRGFQPTVIDWTESSSSRSDD